MIRVPDTIKSFYSFFSRVATKHVAEFLLYLRSVAMMHLPCQHSKICCTVFGKTQITPNNANTKDQISHAKNNGVKDV